MDDFLSYSPGELARLRKRDKVLTWMLTVLIILGIIIGTRLYVVERKAASLQMDSKFLAGTVSTTGYMQCCTSKTRGQRVDLQAINQAGIDYYRQKYRDSSEVKALVKDFGCHVKCDIIKDGKVIKSFYFRDGKFEEV
ncbi:MAG: hypothetical protein M0Z31_10755 [Clostridia bacterium]|nr:hypothetical protein [Clostridia bacterium]